MEKIQSVQGMHDIFGDDQDFFTFIKKVARHRCRQNGIRRITTPVLEYTEVFQKGLGEQTDIVQKEMYTFTDAGEHSLTMRPEGTAGVARAYIEHGMHNLPQPVEFYYIDPMFRRERPQKGRLRQHFQFGVEVMGERDAALDAELIDLAYTICCDLGLKDKIEIVVNSLGSPDNRKKYAEALKDFFAGKERSLNEEDRARLEKNPLRLLDSKDEDCKILLSLAPKLSDFLSKEAREFYENVKQYLTELNIPFREDTTLVRGQDYYTDTVFEIVPKVGSGSQTSPGGGGRYDNLIEFYGGQPTPASGFALGFERLILLMKECGWHVPTKDKIHVFVIQLGDEAKLKSMKLMKEMRLLGIKARASFGKDSIKSQLRLADKFDAPFALILGQLEVKQKTIILRDMKKGSQQIIKFDEAMERIVEAVGETNLDTFNFESELIPRD